MTYYQTCMNICIAVILFSLCANFINALHVFPTYSNEITPGSNTNETLSDITGYTFTDLWSWITSITGTATIGILTLVGLGLIIYLTHSPAIIGAYLFTTIFWGSFLSAIGVLASANFLNIAFMPVFVGLFTVIIGIIWFAAVIGMFTGNG